MPPLSRLVHVLGATAVLAAVGSAQAPANNACSGAFPLVVGVNPQPPGGQSGATYTNVGATNSTSVTFGVECAPTAFNKDVWFTFHAPLTGTYVFSTCTPGGFAAGSLTLTILAVYPAADCPTGGVALLCNDDSAACGAGSNRSALSITLNSFDDYLIRVGTESATATGTFYVTVTAPPPAVNDGCTGALPLALGANPGSYEGTQAFFPIAYGCTGFNFLGVDVWYSYQGTLADALQGVEVAIEGVGSVDHLAVFSGACPVNFSTVPVDCGASVVTFVPGVQTYYVRVLANYAAVPALGFSLTVTKTARPDHEVCTAAAPFSGGVFPYVAAPSMSTSNAGALDTDFGAAPGSCLQESNSHVWFDYVAPASGRVAVSTVNPAGAAPGTLIVSVVGVFSTCPAGSAASLLGCDVYTIFSAAPTLFFDAVQGTHYKVVVGGYGQGQNEEGSFWLTIVPQFRLTMSAPNGPGTIQIDVEDGGPNHAFFTCLTVNQGLYPYGPFFGIQPTFFEVVLQLTSNAEPFIGFLNGAGDYQFGPAPSIAGLTLYGVTLQFDAAASVAGVTPHTTFTVP